MSPFSIQEVGTDVQKTATGLFLPSSATSSPLPEATVIAVGPGAPNKEGVLQAVSVKVGDRVLLPGWGGSPIKVGEEVSLFRAVLRIKLIDRNTTCSRTRRSWPRSTSRLKRRNRYTEGSHHSLGMHSSPLFSTDTLTHSQETGPGKSIAHILISIESRSHVHLLL
jgi:co-chaperonin GroES (HSP10)